MITSKRHRVICSVCSTVERGMEKNKNWFRISVPPNDPGTTTLQARENAPYDPEESVWIKNRFSISLANTFPATASQSPPPPTLNAYYTSFSENPCTYPRNFDEPVSIFHQTRISRYYTHARRSRNTYCIYYIMFIYLSYIYNVQGAIPFSTFNSLPVSVSVHSVYFFFLRLTRTPGMQL